MGSEESRKGRANRRKSRLLLRGRRVEHCHQDRVTSQRLSLQNLHIVSLCQKNHPHTTPLQYGTALTLTSSSKYFRIPFSVSFQLDRYRRLIECSPRPFLYLLHPYFLCIPRAIVVPSHSIFYLCLLYRCVFVLCVTFRSLATSDNTEWFVTRGPEMVFKAV